MSATNAAIIKKAIADYHKKIIDEVEKRCDSYCGELLQQAIDARIYMRPLAHDFTGNLLNSIVVCLYKERKPVKGYYAYEQVGNAIAPKMTYPKRYFFAKDYMGARSKYRPEVPAVVNYGEHDAMQFFREYHPKGNNLFDIVVAYPVEYAEWVEKERHSTGILRAYDNADKVAVTILKLPRKRSGYVGTIS